MDLCTGRSRICEYMVTPKTNPSRLTSIPMSRMLWPLMPPRNDALRKSGRMMSVSLARATSGSRPTRTAPSRALTKGRTRPDTLPARGPDCANTNASFRLRAALARARESARTATISRGWPPGRRCARPGSDPRRRSPRTLQRSLALEAEGTRGALCLTQPGGAVEGLAAEVPGWGSPCRGVRVGGTGQAEPALERRCLSPAAGAARTAGTQRRVGPAPGGAMQPRRGPEWKRSATFSISSCTSTST